jgi:inner membrane protein
MPTFIGHGISGLAIGSFAARKPYSKKALLLCMACSIAPDLDAVTFRIGIPYSHWLGHRGFSHSLLFAGILATADLFSLRKAEPSGKIRAGLWACFFISTALHDLLDAMTNGGLGIAFFSPFDTTRYFLPWRPIEVSPIALGRFLSPRGSLVLQSEFFWVMIPSFFILAALRLIKRSKAPDIQ